VATGDHDDRLNEPPVYKLLTLPSTNDPTYSTDPASASHTSCSSLSPLPRQFNEVYWVAASAQPSTFANVLRFAYQLTSSACHAGSAKSWDTLSKDDIDQGNCRDCLTDVTVVANWKQKQKNTNMRISSTVADVLKVKY